jgi:hypothetical protein
VRNRWLTAEAIKLHILAFVLVFPMLGLGWWQLQRALGGHTRSWAYAIQWPAFAAYAVFIWWKLLRETPGFAKPAGGDAPNGAEPRRSARQARAAAKADAEERELAEYNERLAAYRERLAALRDADDRRSDR